MENGIGKHYHRTGIILFAFLALAAFAIWAPCAEASSSYFSSQGCTGCHIGQTGTSYCGNCHSHGTHPSSAKSSINVAASAAPTLSSFTIAGPTSVNEGATGTYTATAHYSDGSTQIVAPTWSVSAGSITSAGVFTAPQVTANQMVSINASFGGLSAPAYSVTVVNMAATLTGLAIGSPSIVPEKTTAAYTATASWSDGSTSNVTMSATWAVSPGTYATINAGVLTALEVPSDQTVTLTASYAYGGLTRSATFTVTIKNVEAPPTGPLTVMPVDGATDVPVNTVIKATVESGTDLRTIFNRDTFTLKANAPVGTSSVGTASPLARDDDGEVCVVDGVVQGSIWYNDYRTKAVFTPNCDLDHNMTYIGTVAVGSSGYLAQPLNWQFTTAIQSPDSDDDGSDDAEDDHPHDRRRSSRWSPYGTGLIQIDASSVSGSATSAPAGAADGGSVLRGFTAISDTSARLNQAGRPEGYEFPDGMVSFMMDNVASGSTVTVKVTFPSGIPAGSKVFQADENGFHAVTGFVIDGNKVTMTLTAPPADSGDQGNAITVNPIGVAAPTTTGSGSVDLATSGSSGGCSTAGRTGSAGIDAFLILTGIGLMAWRIRIHGRRS